MQWSVEFFDGATTQCSAAPSESVAIEIAFKDYFKKAGNIIPFIPRGATKKSPYFIGFSGGKYFLIRAQGEAQAAAIIRKQSHCYVEWVKIIVANSLVDSPKKNSTDCLEDLHSLPSKNASVVGEQLLLQM